MLETPPDKYPNALKYIGTALALIACLVALNAHLVLLQGVAWGTMAKAYQQESGSIREAIQRTMGGAEPCALCNAVSTELLRQAAQPENSSGDLATFQLVFLLIPCGAELQLAPTPGTREYPVNPVLEYARGREAPQGPPPRA